MLQRYNNERTLEELKELSTEAHLRCFSVSSMFGRRTLVEL